VLHLLVDTSTWLDVAKRRDGQKWIIPIRVMMRAQKRLDLLVPALIVSEYERNRESIERAMTASVAERFRLLRQDLSEYGGPDRETSVELIRSLEHQVPLIGAMTTRNFDEIAELLADSGSLTPGPAEYARVVERGLARQAPFHSGKASIADAMLIELYRTAAKSGAAEDVFCFITSNHRDFSATDDQRKPHPDLADVFRGTRGQSRYYKGIEGLALALRDYFGDEFDELVQESDFEEEPRTLAEIHEAEHEFFDRIWYERHLMFRMRHEAGDSTKPDSAYRMALKAAERAVERRPDLRPTESDFEWGMWNGKLSALRWVLGDEWDFLDT